jgi:Tfp pilus assembly protein PilO
MISRYERYASWFFTTLSMALGVFLSYTGKEGTSIFMVFLALTMVVLLVGSSVYESVRIEEAEAGEKRAKEHSVSQAIQIEVLTEGYNKRLDEMERAFKEFQAQTSMRRL